MDGEKAQGVTNLSEVGVDIGQAGQSLVVEVGLRRRGAVGRGGSGGEDGRVDGRVGLLVVVQLAAVGTARCGIDMVAWSVGLVGGEV